ncbi:MAG: ATP-binding protein [Candidatus Fermentibacterota bacterium]
MGVRIRRLRVKRAGPLQEELDVRPADMNLVYGANESGKTYVVEALIGFLFRTGRGTTWQTSSGAGRPPDIRGFPIGGKALLENLDEEPVSFTKTGEKLEDRFREKAGLPRELSRLMVVRAGRTRLSDGADDGVGRDVLLDILGGREVLEEVKGRIKKRSRGLEVRDGGIEGHKALLEDREEAAERLERIDQVAAEVEASDDALRLSQLRRRRDSLRQRRELLGQARRHRAWELRKGLMEVGRDLDGLPAERELSQLESGLERLRDSVAALEGRREEVERERERLSGQGWVAHAADTYADLLKARGVSSGVRRLVTVSGATLMAAAVAAGLARLLWPAVASGLLGLGLLLYREAGFGGGGLSDAQLEERSRVEAMYRDTFDEEMAGLASLRARAEELVKQRGSLDQQEKELQQMRRSVERLRGDLEELSRECLGGGLEEIEPEEEIERAREARRELEGRRESLGLELAGLKVPEGEELRDAPGIQWSDSESDTLDREMERLAGEIGEAERNLQTLRTRIAAATGALEAEEWSELLEALRRKRERLEEDYRTETADLLAKAAVAGAVDEFERSENIELAEKLADERVGRLLHELTGRYDGIRLDGGGTLTLGVEGEFDYPLEMLSTGAREQVFLALRSAFAELTFGQPAFLLLDDAFQHSDWQRRRRLVSHCLKLIDRGWQIFYFCMDDHIRDLFRDQAGKLGDRYLEVELKAAT